MRSLRCGEPRRLPRRTGAAPAPSGRAAGWREWWRGTGPLAISVVGVTGVKGEAYLAGSLTRFRSAASRVAMAPLGVVAVVAGGGPSSRRDRDDDGVGV